MVDFATKVGKIQMWGKPPKRKIAKELVYKSLAIFCGFKKYPEPEQNRLKERKEKEKK